MKPIFTSFSSICINLVFILLSQPVSSNNSTLFADIESKSASISKEKIYIHFDKTFYNQGESIWYKIYLVDAVNHTPETLSKVVYVDLIDPNNIIIDSETIKINEGAGHGDFKLPQNATHGAYTIRAYTNFMRNFDDARFFRKTIYVNTLRPHRGFNTATASTKPQIDFSPEGGNMVGGFLNRIVVKATNPPEKGMQINGDIIDDTNTKILHFKTSKFGLGSFQFIPENGRTYKAIVSRNGVKHAYPLPPVKNHGTTIRVDETHHGYRVNVFSSLVNGINNLELIGKQKGEMVCRAELNGKNPKAAIDLPISDLEYGLIQFQLLNKNGSVLSEELAFIDTRDLEQKITITPSKKTYEENELAEIEINFDSLFEENLKANISVAVTEVNPVINGVPDLDITSYLLLNSEIKDNIGQFGDNFDNDSLRKKTVQQILIAQDDNQYLFKDNNTNNELTFLPESGFNLSGVVRQKKNKNKPVKANVTLTYKNSKELGRDQAITDSLGRFNFSNLNFEERTFVALKAKNLSSQKYKGPFTIELDSFSPPLVKTNLISEKNTTKGNVLLKSKLNRNTEFTSQEGEIKLDPVKVTAEKKRLDRFAKKRKLTLYTTPSHTLDFKDLRISPSARNPIQALQGLFPGVHVIGDNIILRGRNSLIGNNLPLFLLDGFPTDLEMITSIPIFSIDFIDIIQSSGASIYGSRGGNGIVAVYTIDGSEENDEENERNGIISFYRPGYYQARAFNQDENDSTTLYWNPDLKLEQSNSAKIAFKTAHKSATYKVLLEGIASNGTPFRAEAYFDVKLTE
ncbi:MG2 domain-containing protein [Hwangdonia lutea]|uniref:MG2 domain-containing protein n=1 Tax=Hwangdonia lutea TaxID=3075823 RepID=A0AA97HRX0_9FLAO|nr:MG2 domain-containing protein [Hwangdonia sp. SCSIO 19198]WOD45107.1 MG2 domain-containing protein [Hwangdonia sp. SCSIO 19198]